MNPSSQTVHIKLSSKPTLVKEALMPLAIGLALGWAFLVLWSVVTYLTFSHNLYFGLSLALGDVAFGVCLSAFTYSLINDALCDYVFEITDTEAALTVVDRMRNSRKTSMILLNDIKYAEYYPYCDSASIILHAPYFQMEVPLWPMGTRGQDIVDFLVGRGVKVVNVQSDDDVPVEH